MSTRQSVRSVLSSRAPWAAALVTLVLIVILRVAFGVERVSAEQTLEYHEHVRSLQSELPYSVNDWVGTDRAVPPAAIEILHPNVLLNRQFENMRTGEVASLLFVQCSDARDLGGHYPPRCYPGQGWVLGTAIATEWVVEGTNIPGMRYTFTKGSAASESGIVVDNFMALPSGEFGRDMDAVGAVAKNPRLRHYGAAQVQVVTGIDFDDARRDEILRELVKPALPILRALTAEANRD